MKMIISPPGILKLGLAIALMVSLTSVSAPAQSFTPNDPYFGEQWHLYNSLGYPHVNVMPAWQRGLTGAGVVIGIIDDAFEGAHEDFAASYSAADSWDFIDNDGDPSPTKLDENHGTAVGGIAAGRGGNGIGITGAAPHATVAGLRIDLDLYAPETTSAEATRYRSTGPDPSIHIKNHSYTESVLYVLAPQTVQSLNDSAAAGTIHVVAAGNDRRNHGGGSSDEREDADTNKKQLANHKDVITVAALGADGRFADYSNFGASVFVTAPSQTDNTDPDTGDSYPGTFTADRTGDVGYNRFGTPPEPADLNYTSTFGGTSSAAPLVAGIMALGKQANPDMEVRLAKHALANTSVIVDPDDSTPTSDGGWKTNAAGFRFNQNYGFGLIDADAFTRFVQTHAVTPPTAEVADHTSLNRPIVTSQLSETFTLSTTDRLEVLEVHLNITRQPIARIVAQLESPSGTISRLTYANPNTSDVQNLDWTFTTNAFWGEIPAGDWTLSLSGLLYFAGFYEGTFDGFSVTAHTGTVSLIPEPGTGVLLAVSVTLILARRRNRPHGGCE